MKYVLVSPESMKTLLCNILKRKSKSQKEADRFAVNPGEEKRCLIMYKDLLAPQWLDLWIQVSLEAPCVAGASVSLSNRVTSTSMPNMESVRSWEKSFPKWIGNLHVSLLCFSCLEIKDFLVSPCVDYSDVGDIKIIFLSVTILTMFRFFC